jgi:hypothetical protein
LCRDKLHLSGKVRAVPRGIRLSQFSDATANPLSGLSSSVFVIPRDIATSPGKLQSRHFFSPKELFHV